MKKYLVIAFILAMTGTTAGAFSLPKVDMGSNKVLLNKCLLEEGTKMLNAGKLTKATINTTATEIVATCTTKLALKNVDDTTVTLAVDVLKTLVK